MLNNSDKNPSFERNWAASYLDVSSFFEPLPVMSKWNIIGRLWRWLRGNFITTLAIQAVLLKATPFVPIAFLAIGQWLQPTIREEENTTYLMPSLLFGGFLELSLFALTWIVSWASIYNFLGLVLRWAGLALGNWTSWLSLDVKKNPITSAKLSFVDASPIEADRAIYNFSNPEHHRRSEDRLHPVPAAIIITGLLFVLYTIIFTLASEGHALIAEWLTDSLFPTTQQSTQENMVAIVLLYFPWYSWLIGVGLMRLGRKLSLLKAKTLRQNDPRKPIVYLRPFKLHASKVRMTGFYSFDGVRLEEVVAEAVAEIGPLIAIGEPGEKFRQIGAAREYFQNETW